LPASRLLSLPTNFFDFVLLDILAPDDVDSVQPFVVIFKSLNIFKNNKIKFTPPKTIKKNKNFSIFPQQKT